MIRPEFLHPGKTVSIVAPGRKIDKVSIDSSVAVLKAWGFTVKLGENLFSTKHSYLSGSDDERLSDLQQVLDDPAINAVLCARGGYGTTRILDRLDFTKFQQAPKWICGFSDITALHLKIQSLGIQSIHSTMPVMFPKEESKTSVESLRNALFGSTQPIFMQALADNRLGVSSGNVVGGNLSLLVESLGTPSEIQTEGKILIVEEVDEYIYRLDRMFVQLKRSGKLRNLAGLVVGHMSDMKESELPFGETTRQLILHHTKEFNFPIAFGFPSGHENPNMAWFEGIHAKLTVTNKGSELRF